MTPADLSRAKDVLAAGGTIAAACKAAGVTRRTLERVWPSYQGETLGRWCKGLQGRPEPRTARPVFFRPSVDDRAELERRAKAAGVSVGQFAHMLVREGLGRG